MLVRRFGRIRRSCLRTLGVLKQSRGSKDVHIDPTKVIAKSSHLRISSTKQIPPKPDSLFSPNWHSTPFVPGTRLEKLTSQANPTINAHTNKQPFPLAPTTLVDPTYPFRRRQETPPYKQISFAKQSPKRAEPHHNNPPDPNNDPLPPPSLTHTHIRYSKHTSPTQPQLSIQHQIRPTPCINPISQVSATSLSIHPHLSHYISYISNLSPLSTSLP